jgi:hypothetical protein
LQVAIDKKPEVVFSAYKYSPVKYPTLGLPNELVDGGEMNE